MKNKAFNIIISAIFVIICIVPLVSMIFTDTSESIGNEQEAELPKIITEDGINTSFSTEFDDYFSQLNPLRTDLINLENTLKIDLLSGSSNGVIKGENGYLFSEETTDDYLGVTLSDRKLYSIAKTIKLTQDYAEQNGSSFVFTVVPNKNSIYPEYMPSRYIQGDENNLSILTENLNALDVNYVDLYSLFTSIDAELYLKDDTHWNNLGALYGYNAIMDALDHSHNDYSGVTYEIRDDFVGDLTDMAFPQSDRTCSQYYFNIEYSDYMFLQPRSEDNAEMLAELMGDEEKIDGLIRTSNPNASGSLYILRDSFGRAMLPFLIDNYESTYITRYQPINLQQSSYDDIVWETVERNISDIAATAPLIYALECEVPENVEELTSGNNIVQSEATDTSVSLYGILDSKYFETDSNIYIVISNDNGEYCYEAFPICETEKLGIDTDSDYGFSLTIDLTSIDAGDYSVSAIISNDNNNFSTGVITQLTKEE